MFNVEKIFKNETAIGRLDFFYIALMFVLWFLQSVPIFLSTTLRSVASCVFASFIALACIVSLFWYLIAVYKRLYSIFDKMIVCILLTIVVVVSILQPLLFLILNILLILIPAKKEITSIFHPMYTIKARIVLLLFYCLNIFNLIHIFGIFSSVSPVSSMENIFKETDKIAISVWESKYKRGDIVAIYSLPSRYRAGRIVGLPNDKVEIKSFDDGAKYVYVNDKKLEEPYVVDNYNYPSCVENNPDEKGAIKCSAVVVPEDSYYILPDNRSAIPHACHLCRSKIVSSKSRIRGRIVRIWYPFDRIRNL